MHSTIGPTKFLQNKNPRIKIVELMEKKKIREFIGFGLAITSTTC
jgi:hypothetical protein